MCLQPSRPVFALKNLIKLYLIAIESESFASSNCETSSEVFTVFSGNDRFQAEGLRWEYFQGKE